MKAHVICNNDSVEHVVFGTEAEAEAELERIEGEHMSTYLKHQGDSPQSREAYQRNYWHIHTVAASFRPGKAKLWEISNLSMTAGNEKTLGRVIDMGVVKRWVGIGWVDERAATDADQMIYPKVARP